MRVSILLQKPSKKTNNLVKTYRKLIKIQSLVDILPFLLRGGGGKPEHAVLLCSDKACNVQAAWELASLKHQRTPYGT